MTNEERKCPGCRRHCSPEEPRCARGKEFARTGVLSERSTDEKLFHALRGIGYMMPGRGRASQENILVILDASDGMTQRELTERLHIQPGSVSEILSKLEAAGYVTRTENETDRRTANVHLTDAGKEKAAEAGTHDRREDLFSCLTEDEKETLLSLLEKLRADWDERFPGRGGPRRGPHGPQGFGPRGPQGFGPHGPQGFGPHGHHGFGPHGQQGFGPRGHHGFGSHGHHAPCGFHALKSPQAFRGFHGSYGSKGPQKFGFRVPHGFGPHVPFRCAGFPRLRSENRE